MYFVNELLELNTWGPDDNHFLFVNTRIAYLNSVFYRLGVSQISARDTKLMCVRASDGEKYMK